MPIIQPIPLNNGTMARTKKQYISEASTHRCRILAVLLLIYVFNSLHYSLHCVDAALETKFEPYFGKFAGALKDFAGHGIRGDLYVVNQNAIFLANFSYDGLGTDVYFKVGSSRTSDIGSTGIVIPDELGRLTPLSQYQKQNILLTLPRELPGRQLKWLSIYSNSFALSLGHALVLHKIVVPEKRDLGQLRDTRDLVRADSVIAIDDKTLHIRKFNFDPSLSGNAGFYVGSSDGSKPNFKHGLRIPDETGSFGRIRPYFNEDVILRLPRDVSITQLSWFAVGDPTAKISFGHIEIPSKNLNIPPNMAFLLTYVTSFSNCETVLPNLMQVAWEVRNKDIYIQLEARIASNQYAAFGLSGSKEHSKMIGSDVFVAYYDASRNQVMLEDYSILGTKAICNSGARTGVCRDTAVGGTQDLDLLMSSYIDGLVKITFRRPLKTVDRYDRQFTLNRHMPIVAAIGTLDQNRNPSYHTVAVNTKYHLSRRRTLETIDFGRPRAIRSCDPPLWSQVVRQPANAFNLANLQTADSGQRALTEIEPWKPAVIHAGDRHVFHVVLGPPGPPQQGYTSITGIEQPKVAFWIDDLLIPELHVRRGSTYTFILETGNNSTDTAHYHPFYITESREGGGSSWPEILGRSGHRIFAGIEILWGTPDPGRGTGRYCELKEISKIDPYKVRSIEDYRHQLTLNCKHGNVGAFQWTPDEQTPDLVYYQSFTHRFVGWKIFVSSGASSSTVAWPYQTSFCLSLIITSSWIVVTFVFFTL